MKENEAILKRQEYKIKFNNKDMDFLFNWIMGIGYVVGMSAGEMFYIASGIRDGNPGDWRKYFNSHTEYLKNEAEHAKAEGYMDLASHLYFSACYSQRAALQFTDVQTQEYFNGFHMMETFFMDAVDCSHIPLKKVAVPFNGKELPGYMIFHDDKPKDTIMIVGGGDTSREDLFYFAGHPGWKNGYNVLMLDLPGQGMNPAQGLHFSVDAGEAISAVLDWYDAPTENIAIMGLSGGGYFTAQGIEKDSRIKAWIASTPIYDVAEVFRVSFRSAVKAPKAVIRLGAKVISNFNEAADINLKKYAWQFGTPDFLTSVNEVLAQARVVDYKKISIPSLFLVGEGESRELQRQTDVIYNDFRSRGVDVTVKRFSGASGADAHCQVNNLRLMHAVVFDWLNRIFVRE